MHRANIVGVGAIGAQSFKVSCGCGWEQVGTFELEEDAVRVYNQHAQVERVHRLKKGCAFATPAQRAFLNQFSKAALLDMVCTLAQLGTDESEAQVLSKVAREAEIVAIARGDRLPPETAKLAAVPIDSD